MTVPTIQRTSRVSRLAISVRTPAISVDRQPRVEARNLGPHLGEASLELVGGDVIAVLEAVVDRLGDDLGLIAGDAASGELLGDGERVEHQGSLPRAAGAGGTGPAAPVGSKDDFEAKAREALSRFSARVRMNTHRAADEVNGSPRYQTWRCPAAIGGNDLSRHVGRDTSAAPQPHFDVAAGADGVPRATADADVATLQRRLWPVQPADAEGRPPNTAFDSLKIRADLRGDLVRQLTLSPIPRAAHSPGSVVTVAAPRGAWVRRDHGTDMVRIEVPAGSPLKAENRPAATLGTRPRDPLGPHSMQA